MVHQKLFQFMKWTVRDWFEPFKEFRRGLGMSEDKAPKGLDKNIVGFEFAPYSLVFSHAACVVHQAGIGTTAQVLRAGVPHLMVPFSHDQPDNAARCRRAGVAEIISRQTYSAETASKVLASILDNEIYRTKATALKRIVGSEDGTAMACDAIEDILRK
jgi:UDP:flavonoid glycosyltransferase YjiC (YdhE family)